MLLATRLAPVARAPCQLRLSRCAPLLLRRGKPSTWRVPLLHAADPVTCQENIVQAFSGDQKDKPEAELSAFTKARAERAEQRVKEAMVYRVSAIAATVLVLSIAIVATYYRFVWHLADEGDVPLDEMAATLLLVFGGIFGMEMYARFAHKVLWHDYEPGWALHKSHHEPRTGPFEANDIYAVVNAVPAMALCLYGFLTPHVIGGVCFGAGLGITLFGIMYMFFHDGLVHRRFPVGPIAQMPYMKRVMAAHQIHHSNKFDGVPFGMFLGPQELEAVPGGREELDRLVAALEAKEAGMKQTAA